MITYRTTAGERLSVVAAPVRGEKRVELPLWIETLSTSYGPLRSGTDRRRDPGLPEEGFPGVLHRGGFLRGIGLHFRPEQEPLAAADLAPEGRLLV